MQDGKIELLMSDYEGQKEIFVVSMKNGVLIVPPLLFCFFTAIFVSSEVKNEQN